MDTEELAGMELGVITEEDILDKTTAESLTQYYKPWRSRRGRKVLPDSYGVVSRGMYPGLSIPCQACKLEST